MKKIDRNIDKTVILKYNDAPRLTKSMNNVIEYLDLSHLWVVYPGNKSYPLTGKITVLPISQSGKIWDYS